jgi:hypothetical protein
LDRLIWEVPMKWVTGDGVAPGVAIGACRSSRWGLAADVRVGKNAGARRREAAARRSTIAAYGIPTSWI